MRRLVACLVLACAALTVTSQAQPDAVRMRFVSPTADTYLAGAVLLRVTFDGESARVLVRDVTFFADGTQVCVAAASRPECAWDAGAQVREHTLRAVARLQDDRRLVANVRTKGLDFAESVSVQIVQVNAVVTSGGKFVSGLSRDAFRVLDDGENRPLTSFSEAGAPLELVLALDVSGSMADALGDVRDAARAFLQALGPQDQATVVAFNDRMYTLARREVDPATRLASLDRLGASGGTALYDVVAAALELLSRQPGRRALVLFSDGDDRNSDTTFAQIQQAVRDGDATVFAVGLGRGAQVKDVKERLEALADASGGRALFADRSDRLKEPFAEIVADLKNQYALGFEPRHDGRYHSIAVEVPGRRVQVRSRRGYTAPR
jgi:Ca-activated chloride channel family protein